MRDCFAILGLKPDRYDPSALARRFVERRRELLSDRRRAPSEVHRSLDELHVAYALLRDRNAQTDHQRELSRSPADPLTGLQHMIAASLEDGLLRRSRREAILAEGRRRGLSDFHTHLLIAQTQFGRERVLAFDDPRDERLRDSQQRSSARFAAALVLGLALFLATVRMLGV